MPAGRGQPRDRLGRGGRAGPRREPRRAGPQLHRPRRHGPAHRRARGTAPEAALARAGRQERHRRAGRRGPGPRRRRHRLVRLRHDRSALHRLLTGHRAGRGRRRAGRLVSWPGRAPCAWVPVSIRRRRSGPLINRGGTSRRSPATCACRPSKGTRASWSRAASPASGAGLEHGHFFQPDHRRPRAAHEPPGPGGGLRAGPVGHPGARLRRRR